MPTRPDRGGEPDRTAPAAGGLLGSDGTPRVGLRLLGLFQCESSHSTWVLRLEGAEADGGGVDPYRGRVSGAGAHGGLRGVSLLGFISRRSPGYLDNPVRQNLFRAGHAHAGVLIILALVGRRDLTLGIGLPRA
jgi:hypothetical protein